MSFSQWFFSCLARFPQGGVPGYWAWFVGTVGLATAVFSYATAEPDPPGMYGSVIAWGSITAVSVVILSLGFIVSGRHKR